MAGTLSMGNGILEELPFIKQRVAACFPPDYDVFNKFAVTYMEALEKAFKCVFVHISIHSLHPHLTFKIYV